MAKGNMLLGQARGKVGDIVFSRNNGKQVIKARSEQVKNPQTQAQVLQRILLNTVSQAYSKFLAICDHSFEGVKTGQDTMSVFMKRNLNQIRNRVVNLKNQTGSLSGFYAVTPIGSKALALNPYIMSTGTLPVIAVTSLSAGAALDSVATIELPGLPEEITYESFISAYGLRRGDQVTFITLNYDANQGITFNFARVILDPMNADGTPALISSALIADGAILNASDRNEGNFARLVAEGGKINFSCAGGVVCGACVIVSRQDDSGEWMRSNAVLSIPSDVTNYDQYALLDAIDLFYSGGLDFESSYYLNNAERSSSSGTDSSSAKPYVGTLTLDGKTILGKQNNVNITASAAAVLYAAIGNWDDEGASKIVIVSRQLNVGSGYSQQSGDIVVALASGVSTYNVNLSAAGEYNVYFVNGGFIVSEHAHLIVAAAGNYLTVDGAAVDDIETLNLAQGTAHTIVINNSYKPSSALPLEIESISSSSSSAVAVNGATVSTQGQVTTVSFAATVPAGTYYGIYNNEGVNVASTITLATNSAPQVPGEGGE